jgi:C1A family cysteine protease
LKIGDVGALKTAVNKQPVSVCVDAGNWKLYKSGKFNNCLKAPLSHAVLLVGYNEDGSWIVKNSWGTGWG